METRTKNRTAGRGEVWRGVERKKKGVCMCGLKIVVCARFVCSFELWFVCFSSTKEIKAIKHNRKKIQPNKLCQKLINYSIQSNQRSFSFQNGYKIFILHHKRRLSVLHSNSTGVCACECVAVCLNVYSTALPPSLLFRISALNYMQHFPNSLCGSNTPDESFGVHLNISIHLD